MKRIKFFIMGIIVIGVFIGCDIGSETKTQYYYYEAFTITKSNYNSVPLPVSATFATVKNYRDSLKSYMIDFVGSGTDATQSDIYNLLTQKGMTPTDANNEISFLNSVGNNVGIFFHATDNTLYVIIYLEKL